ncbi:MAG: fumarylacetoacetate hydrolase family protein [Deltaproteobacteria bacterium]|nr:fumarylacetoacetate hydrolase family protein [Deltaproteobacteria bacterium]
MKLEYLGQYWNPETRRVHLLGRGGAQVRDLTPHLPYASTRELLLSTLGNQPGVETLLESAPFPTVQAVQEAERAGTTVPELLRGPWEQAMKSGAPLSLEALDSAPESGRAHLLACVLPLRAQAFGVTYESSALERESEGKKEDYVYVYKSTRERKERCEVFIKGTRLHHFFGPRGKMGLRSDLTNSVDAKGRPKARVAVLAGIEPELAAVTYSDGRIMGYTLADDGSGNQIENESILYLYQAKYFVGCTGLGPWLWLSNEQDNPGVTFSVTVRDGNGKSLFEASADTRRIGRPIREMVEIAASHNPLYPGEVFLTGTDIAPNESAKVLQPGWEVEIHSERLGVFRHGAVKASAAQPGNPDYHALERGRI